MDEIFKPESGIVKNPSDLTEAGRAKARENIRALGHTGTDEEIEASLGQIEADLRVFDTTVAGMIVGSTSEKLEIIQTILGSDNHVALGGLLIAGITRHVQVLRELALAKAELALAKAELEALRAGEGLKARPAVDETTRFS